MHVKPLNVTWSVSLYFRTSFSSCSALRVTNNTRNTDRNRLTDILQRNIIHPIKHLNNCSRRTHQTSEQLQQKNPSNIWTTAAEEPIKHLNNCSRRTHQTSEQLQQKNPSNIWTTAAEEPIKHTSKSSDKEL